jgi:hypothetical protein
MTPLRRFASSPLLRGGTLSVARQSRFHESTGHCTCSGRTPVLSFFFLFKR